MAGLRISREKGVSGWLICVFLEKKAGVHDWFAYFSRKKRVWMAGLRISREKKCVWIAGFRISREKGMSGWLICVFLEKKACLDG